MLGLAGPGYLAEMLCLAWSVVVWDALLAHDFTRTH